MYLIGVSVAKAEDVKAAAVDKITIVNATPSGMPADAAAAAMVPKVWTPPKPEPALVFKGVDGSELRFWAT